MRSVSAPRANGRAEKIGRPITITAASRGSLPQHQRQQPGGARGDQGGNRLDPAQRIGCRRPRGAGPHRRAQDRRSRLVSCRPVQVSGLEAANPEASAFTSAGQHQVGDRQPQQQLQTNQIPTRHRCWISVNSRSSAPPRKTSSDRPACSGSSCSARPIKPISTSQSDGIAEQRIQLRQVTCSRSTKNATAASPTARTAKTGQRSHDRKAQPPNLLLPPGAQRNCART